MSSGTKRKALAPLFFHVGTNDAAKGNLENIKSDCRALGAMGRGMRAQVVVCSILPVRGKDVRRRWPSEVSNANARSIGSKPKELVICVQSQGSDLVGITERWWDGCRDWSVMIEGHRLIRKDRPRRRGGVVLHVRQQLECLELCLGMGEQPTESL